MKYRQLGKSGFKVPVLSFGAGTFGVRNYSKPGEAPMLKKRPV